MWYFFKVLFWLVLMTCELRKVEIVFSSHWWDFLFSVCPCQFYSKLLELWREVECVNSTSHACTDTCTHSHTHITWPRPSAAGDYVDYRMIRTPPSSSLPSFTVDLSAQRKPLRSEERPPVSSPSLWKGVVFPLRPELKISDPSVNYCSAEQRGISWKGQTGVLQI